MEKQANSGWMLSHTTWIKHGPKGRSRLFHHFFLQGKDCPNHEKHQNLFEVQGWVVAVVVVVVFCFLTEVLGLGGHLLPRLNQLWIGLRRHTVVHGIYTWTYTHKYSKTYCWWKKSCTSWYGKYHILYRVLYIAGGAGFLPSTVIIVFNNLWLKMARSMRFTRLLL